MDAKFSPLMSHIRKFVPLSDGQASALQQIGKFKKVSNKDLLLKEGEICDEQIFIVKGILRKFYNTEKGNQQIIQFCVESWWMTDYNSYESGEPSLVNIQAIEDCEVLIFKKHDLDVLFDAAPIMERYFRKILQRAYEATLTRTYYIFSFSGKERYQHFAESFPTVLQRIPQYMLASYLGFTPEFLSKIRAKKR